ncbi:MAG: DUF2283 domain-containing protein [Candidatus Nanoarchaeia archaeon]
MQEFNFDYDKENDDLFLYSGKSKSKGSVEIGGIILDYNTKKELVGIELMNASEILKDITDGKCVLDVLNNLEVCKVDVKRKNKMIIIKLLLLSKKREIMPILSIPIMKKSPALYS